MRFVIQTQSAPDKAQWHFRAEHWHAVDGVVWIGNVDEYIGQLAACGVFLALSNRTEGVKKALTCTNDERYD